MAAEHFHSIFIHPLLRTSRRRGPLGNPARQDRGVFPGQTKRESLCISDGPASLHGSSRALNLCLPTTIHVAWSLQLVSRPDCLGNVRSQPRRQPLITGTAFKRRPLPGSAGLIHSFPWIIYHFLGHAMTFLRSDSSLFVSLVRGNSHNELAKPLCVKLEDEQTALARRR